MPVSAAPASANFCEAAMAAVAAPGPGRSRARAADRFHERQIETRRRRTRRQPVGELLGNGRGAADSGRLGRMFVGRPTRFLEASMADDCSAGTEYVELARWRPVLRAPRVHWRPTVRHLAPVASPGRAAGRRSRPSPPSPTPPPAKRAYHRAEFFSQK